jgi:hypothetical protein
MERKTFFLFHIPRKKYGLLFHRKRALAGKSHVMKNSEFLIQSFIIQYPSQKEKKQKTHYFLSQFI